MNENFINSLLSLYFTAICITYLLLLMSFLNSLNYITCDITPKHMVKQSDKIDMLIKERKQRQKKNDKIYNFRINLL